MLPLVIATQNAHKFQELREQLRPLKSQLDLLSLVHFPSYVPPPETGATFEENAERKARHAAAALQMWVLADDSGLVVPAIGGEPGVFSARYAGPDATDKENRHKLLTRMASLQGEMRSAYFECVLALASPDGHCRIAKGRCEGWICESERGRNGFGYDALFCKHDYAQTFGELSQEVKGRISHRGKAMRSLLNILESLLASLQQ